MWERESLTRTSTVMNSFQELVEHMEVARVRSEWLSLPVYFHSALSAYKGALARQACDVSLETLKTQEQRVQEWLWRRFEGAPRVVYAVRLYSLLYRSAERCVSSFSSSSAF
jgi:hypothetical protein